MAEEQKDVDPVKEEAAAEKKEEVEEQSLEEKFKMLEFENAEQKK